MAHPLIEQAAQHLAQARAIDQEFEGKAMPEEAGRQMKAHLDKASELRGRADAKEQLKAHEDWLAEPVYTHNMTGAPGAKDADSGDLTAQRRYDGPTGPWDADLPQGLSQKSAHSVGQFVMGHKAALVEDATGQSIVPDDWAGVINREMARLGVVRSLATVRPTTSNRVHVGAINVATPTWNKLETSGTPAADGLGSPPADDQVIRVWNLTALVKIGADELEDALAAEQIIRAEVAEKFAEAEDDAFAGGTGDANTMPWAITHNVTQGLAAAAGETIVVDDLRNLPFTVPARQRANGAFFGPTDVENSVALLTDADGHYLWEPSMQAGRPATLFGYPWYTLDGLPSMDATVDAGAGTNASLVFGDLKAAYHIADRRRFTVQRLVEQYAEDGQVGLLFRQRVGGDIVRPRAMARLLL